MKNLLILISCLVLNLYLSLLSAEEANPMKQGILNKLLAPGPLIEGHKKLEKVDCLSCHSAGSGLPDTNCLTCHKEIKASIELKNTFHGKHNDACFHCHSDHKGREYNTISVDQKKFDHKETGHILYGKHNQIKCIDCHKNNRSDRAFFKELPRYFGATTTCVSCHKKDDVHFYQGQFAKMDCNKCHGEASFKENVDFKHDKVSDFKLIGKHEKISCDKCHTPEGKKIPPGIYKWPNLKTDNCLACHKPFHKDYLSEKYNNGKCETCHNQNEWKLPNFKHELTGFHLKGKHAEITCVKCHKETPPEEKVSYQISLAKFSKSNEIIRHKYLGLKTTCISCHKDYHGFGQTLVSTRYGSLLKCESCHVEKSFKAPIDFNHNLDTRFKINGKHTDLACFKCHTNVDKLNTLSDRQYHWEGLEKDNCVICHKSPHLTTFTKKNLEKRCSTCHVTTSWKDRKSGDGFNHNTDTNFEINGKHSALKCVDCHKEGKNKVFKFQFSDKQYCMACHANVHSKQFSLKFREKSCLECHTTNDFKKIKTFDHNKTDFPLTGSHQELNNQCYTCHKPTKIPLMYKGKPVKYYSNFKFEDDKEGRCNYCHKNVHIGQFKKDTTEKSCTFCHDTVTFEKRKPFNHNETNFSLLGYHEKAKCEKCHLPSEYRFEKSKKIKNPRGNEKHNFIFLNLKKENCSYCHKDVHKGEFGKSCIDCHSETKKWKTTQNFHKNFTLQGVHYTLRCNECHKDQRRLSGASENCQACHQKDDIHRGTLPNCKECHRQQFWEVTTFKHSRTSFPLRGTHRTLNCNECHRSGAYQGLAQECLSCHTAALISAQTADIATGRTLHSSSLTTNCKQCHDTFLWK